MKVQSLLLGTLLLLHCNISHAEESSKVICEKGIFPNSAPQKEGVIPLNEDNDLEDSDTTTQPYDNTQQNPNQSYQTPPGQSQDSQRQNPPPRQNQDTQRQNQPNNNRTKNYGME